MRSLRAAGLILALALVLGGGFFALRSRSNVAAETVPSATAEKHQTPPDQPAVQIGTARFAVETACDAAAIQQGLSGRPSLAEGTGMLFLFPKPYRYRFWMPDMHFPLDIIWIAHGAVVAITEEVPPEDDREHPDFYEPSEPAQYVLEVNAGTVAREHIRVGNPVVFYHIK